jgi:hypothetical protein
MKRFQTIVVMLSLLVLCVLLVSACASETTTTTTTTAASVQPPAGFVRYTGGGAEIYLPPYFDWDMNDPTTVSSLRLLGSSGLEQFMRLDQPIVVLASPSTDWTEFGYVDAYLESTGSENVSLEKYVDELKPEYVVYGGKLVSRSDLVINGREAIRVVVEGNVPEEFVGEDDGLSFAAFFVAVPDGYWIIRYTAYSSRFPDRLADFDASASTFRIIP